jgi:hypothetical protein
MLNGEGGTYSLHSDSILNKNVATPRTMVVACRGKFERKYMRQGKLTLFR